MRIFMIVTFCGLAAGQTRVVGTSEADRLPVKKVILYKSGVGYFEHQGPVEGSQAAAISFTAGQLNDALKSLTVLDLGGGKVTGVTYGSAAPLERQMGELQLAIGEKTTLSEFLGALRGARIEVRNGTAVLTGKLLSVERKTRISGGTTLEVDYVSLLGEGGEIKTAEISPSFSFRLLEASLAARVDRYMGLVAAKRDEQLRRMVISTAGAGTRPLFVSYISEVPIWKTTYRIVLPSKSESKPFLQGWAIVDNTVGEDWEKVDLSLVAGAPQSFIQKLSQPYYSRRPEVALPQAVSLTPQTYQATLIAGGAKVAGVVRDPTGAVVAGARVRALNTDGQPVGETTTGLTGEYELASLPDGELRLEISMEGFRHLLIAGVQAAGGQTVRQDARLAVGNVSSAVQVTAAPANLETSSSVMAGPSSLGSGRAMGGMAQNRVRPGAGGNVGGGVFRIEGQVQLAATAQSLGDLFEYKLKEPITILKNQSAMVPIVQSPLAAEKVSIWNEASGAANPLRGLWLTNSTGLTLDGGSFNVIEADAFAGEGLIDPLRPDEKRLISYAVDLAVTAGAKNETESTFVRQARINKGVLIFTSEIREKKTYTFRNQDTAPRMVIVEHPVRSNYKLVEGAEPAESTAAWRRFRLPLAAKETGELVVRESRPVQATVALTNLTPQHLAAYVTARQINAEMEKELRRIFAQKDILSAAKQRKSTLEEEKSRIFDDQQRVRENLKALKGTAEEKALVQRYTQQLNAQETRLAELEKLIDAAGDEEDAAQEALDKLIQEMTLTAEF